MALGRRSHHCCHIDPTAERSRQMRLTRKSKLFFILPPPALLVCRKHRTEVETRACEPSEGSLHVNCHCCGGPTQHSHPDLFLYSVSLSLTLHPLLWCQNLCPTPVFQVLSPLPSALIISPSMPARCSSNKHTEGKCYGSLPGGAKGDHRGLCPETVNPKVK